GRLVSCARKPGGQRPKPDDPSACRRHNAAPPPARWRRAKRRCGRQSATWFPGCIAEFRQLPAVAAPEAVAASLQVRLCFQDALARIVACWFKFLLLTKLSPSPKAGQ